MLNITEKSEYFWLKFNAESLSISKGMMLESRHKEALNHRENVAYKNSKVDDNYLEYLKENNLRFKKFKESLARKIKEKKTCTHNSINNSIEHKNKRHNLLKSQREIQITYLKKIVDFSLIDENQTAFFFIYFFFQTAF